MSSDISRTCLTRKSAGKSRDCLSPNNNNCLARCARITAEEEKDNDIRPRHIGKNPSCEPGRKRLDELRYSSSRLHLQSHSRQATTGVCPPGSGDRSRRLSRSVFYPSNPAEVTPAFIGRPTHLLHGEHVILCHTLPGSRADQFVGQFVAFFLVRAVDGELARAVEIVDEDFADEGRVMGLRNGRSSRRNFNLVPSTAWSGCHDDQVVTGACRLTGAQYPPLATHLRER